MSNRQKSGGEILALWSPNGEVAALLAVARSTVWRWLDAGLIPPPRRVGRRTRWCREEVELFARCRSMAEFERLRKSIPRKSPA